MREAIGLSKSPMLAIRDLSYSFEAGKPIFQQVAIDIQPGEFVSVIGPSGSGKSTLFKLITGLLEPDQGEILTM